MASIDYPDTPDIGPERLGGRGDALRHDIHESPEKYDIWTQLLQVSPGDANAIRALMNEVPLTPREKEIAERFFGIGAEYQRRIDEEQEFEAIFSSDSTNPGEISTTPNKRKVTTGFLKLFIRPRRRSV